eukprot:scaffold144958_cov25-Prasinocladus_malaysianus.AAC.2
MTVASSVASILLLSPEVESGVNALGQPAPGVPGPRLLLLPRSERDRSGPMTGLGVANLLVGSCFTTGSLFMVVDGVPRGETHCDVLKKRLGPPRINSVVSGDAGAGP